MAGVDDARARWGVIQSRGRVRGLIALAVALLIVVLISVLAGSNATSVAIVIVLALVVLGAIVGVVGKRKTGLGLTPEWKPEPAEDDFDDDGEDEDTGEVAEAEPARPETPSDTEPVRRLDAQILGEDLAKLGQVVSPKLAKSYSVGTLVLEQSMVAWEPGTVSRAAGIETLTTAPAQVSAVETAPLWGSWALIRVATAEGEEWCMRVPGSVDLSPAFAEMGLTVRRVE